LKTNDYLQFAVLTGCLRISKESIFTGLNNLKVYSVADENFDEYFGFTEDEVEQMLEYYGLKEYRAEMKEWYDGYRFGQQDVYCPWDVINYCHDLITTKNARVKSYWINTSGNDMVRNLIDRSTTGAEKLEIERLIAGEVISKMINDKLTYNEIALDINNIWSVLFMTGYLTMAGEPDGDF
ncbi:MAG: AAA family ATPase, partial [Bacillota bacterium]